MAISENDVHTAADALLLAGERPTIERVRLRMGRGSPNTITGFLNTWFARLGPRLAGQQSEGIPEPLLAAVGDLWRVAQATAHAQADRNRAAAEATLAQAREALQARSEALQVDVARVNAREEDLEVALEAMRQQLADAQQQAFRATDERDSARAAQLHLEQAIQQARDEVLSLKDLHMQQNAEHAAALREAHARHDAQERRWLTELDAERQAGKRLQFNLEKARAAAERERAEFLSAAARQTAEMQGLQCDYAQTKADLETLRARSELEAGRADSDRAAAQTRDAENVQRIRDLAQQLANKEKQLAVALSSVVRRPPSRRAISG